MAEAHDAYIFTRDYLDNSRSVLQPSDSQALLLQANIDLRNSINLQHCLWVESYGYLTHPKIPLHGGNLRIADVGTGTG